MGPIPRPYRFVTALVLCDVSSLFVREFVRRLLVDSGETPYDAARLSAVAGFIWLTLLVWPLIRKQHISIADMFRMPRSMPGTVLVGITIGLALRGIDDLLLPWMALPMAASLSVEPIQARSWLIALTSLVILTPLLEEIVYRGLVFRCLASHSRLFGYAGSATVFALLHPASVIPVAFLFGLVAAMQYDRSRSLWGPWLRTSFST